MTIPANAVHEIAIRGTFQGSKIQNVFHFTNSIVTPDVSATTACEAFWNDIKAAWRGWTPTSPQLIWTEVVCTLRGAGGQYGSYAIPGAEQSGTRAFGSDFLPSFNAANITFNPSLRLVRPGSKRIAGVLEGDQVSGVLTGGAVALLSTLAVALVNGFTDAVTGASYTYIIWGQVNSNRPVEVKMPINGYTVSVNVTSQVSRKLGRGI